MNRASAPPTLSIGLAIVGMLWLSSLAPAQAETVTDTFPLKLTAKSWCRNDPKIVDTFKWKATDGQFITFTRDPLGTGDLTDLQARITTQGDNLNTIVNATLLKGRVFPTNASGSIAKLVLSGAEPGNPSHVITLQATATFDKTLTHFAKVTGTYVIQGLADSGSALNVDCFWNGTFVAGKMTGREGGTLTVTNAPSNVGGTFVANGAETLVKVDPQLAFIGWTETTHCLRLPPLHCEVVTFGIAPIPIFGGEIITVGFTSLDVTGLTPADTKLVGWMCDTNTFDHTVETSPCGGTITWDRATGWLAVKDVVLTDIVSGTPPITLNGVLTFKPF